MARHEECIDLLVLVYCMACPLKCDFCCHPPEEYGNVKMMKEEAIDYILQAGELETMSRVVFTGGEPFLYYEELLEIMEATSETYFPFRIVTSGYWSKSYEIAIEKLEPLLDLGMDELSLSTDKSHQQFVPAHFIEIAIQAAMDLGIVTEIASVFWDADTKVEDIVNVPEDVNVVRGVVAPIGRAKRRNITPQDYHLESTLERFTGCSTNGIYSIAIYPDGETYPCCSGGFNIEAKLSMGNLNREPLNEIAERIYNDAYMKLVMGYGFKGLYEIAQFKFPELASKLPDYKDFVSYCQLCALIHSDIQLMEEMKPLLDYGGKLIEAISRIQIKSA